MIPQFAQPLWLAAGLGAALLLLLLFLFTERRATRRLHTFAAPALAGRLAATHSRRRLWFKHALILLAVLLLGASLARPQWGADWEKAETRGIDVMIALDTSRSMLATDISPNRLERSKLAVLDLLESVRGDRVGLIAFAGNAFLQCPLTLDYNAFRQTLSAVDTDTIPVGGTDVASAIDEAEAYFEQTGNERILILITDGEDLEASGVQRAREAAGKGTRILCVGVGSTRGELIPITTPDGRQDFLRDPAGNPVSTSLDEATLRRIAQASDGLYAPLGPTGDGLLRVYEFNLAQSETAERREMLQRIPIERYQWPLALAVFILLLEVLLGTRRKTGSASAGVLPVFILLAAIMGVPGSLRAGTAEEAAKAYQDGRYEESVTLYREAIESDPENAKLLYNAGVSAYRSGRHDEAAGLFERAIRLAGGKLQVKAFYNAGNSRVGHGFALLEEQPGMVRQQWEAAILDYENALALDPENRKAERNLERIRQTIEAHTHTLTVLADPENGGTVSPGARVFHRVPHPIQAEAAGGWVFSEWRGDAVEEPDKAATTAVLEEDATVTARFVKTWNLEVISENPEMGTAGESGTYREDQPVDIKAEAGDYFAFSKWSAEGCEVADETQAETKVTLTQDARVTASFVPAFKLTTMVEPEIGGKAGPSGFFEEYSVVPIQAEPRDGFEWTGWTGDGIKEPEAAQTTIGLTADRVAIARMERIWNLVIIPLPEDGGTVEGAGNHPVGSTVPIKAIPAEGFSFEGWDGPGVADPRAAETVVTVASTEHTLFARFARDDEDQQDQQENQDQQQDQQQQDQQQDQQSSEDNQQEQEEEQSGDQQEQQQEEQPSGQEEQEAGDEREEQEQSGEEDGESAREQEARAVPLQMTREEARQLLNALEENERYLPAGERSQKLEAENKTSRGRDW